MNTLAKIFILFFSHISVLPYLMDIVSFAMNINPEKRGYTLFIIFHTASSFDKPTFHVRSTGKLHITNAFITA